MRVYPMNGTDYYPYVYLGVKPYGTQEEYEPVGKYFEGRSTEYTVLIFLNLINVETGESATGYPQQVASTQANFSIVSGGWARIKAWSLTSNASQVSITIERFNPTYTKPVENTYASASVTPWDALQSYLNTSYYVAAGMTNRVTYVGTKHTIEPSYTFTAEEKAKFGDVVGIRLFTESSPAGKQEWMMGMGARYIVDITMMNMYYFLTPNNEQLPANSYMDADIAYSVGGVTKSTISEMLLNEQRGIIFGAAVPSFALIYSYPPSSQG